MNLARPAGLNPRPPNRMDAPLSLRRQLRQSGSVVLPLNREGASVMKITTVGVDLAKTVFQIHGVDDRGRAVLRKQLKRTEMLSFFANLAPCLIGMEACASAHHWARKLIELGHQVKLMAPQFVKPYVKSNKNDRNDAEAICEAVARPNMRFVPVKTVQQQAVLALHRARAGVMKARNAQANQIRGLLGEFGIVLPQGHRSPAPPRTRAPGRWRQWVAGADACAAEQAADTARTTSISRSQHSSGRSCSGTGKTTTAAKSSASSALARSGARSTIFRSAPTAAKSGSPSRTDRTSPPIRGWESWT